MFKDYKEKYLGYYSEKYNYEITIIDSEFEEITTGGPGIAHALVILAPAVIKIYSSRSLNVSHNLFLFMLKLEKDYDWSISDQINYYKEYIPEYQQYHQEIEKNLLLM